MTAGMGIYDAMQVCSLPTGRVESHLQEHPDDLHDAPCHCYFRSAEPPSCNSYMLLPAG